MPHRVIAECRLNLDAMTPLCFVLTALLMQAPQTIRSGVEVLAVDVQVVDKAGYAFPRLGPDDFEVTIDGRPRRVLSVDLVEHLGPQSTRTPSTGASIAALAAAAPKLRSSTATTHKRPVGAGALGAEVTDADRDGKLHAIRVRVKQRGAIVRSRTGVVIPK